MPSAYEEVIRDPLMKKPFERFAKRTGLDVVIAFARKPDASGDIVQRYFATNPTIDIKMSPRLFKKGQDAIQNARKDTFTRRQNLEARIKKGRAGIDEKLKLSRLIKQGKSGLSDKDAKAAYVKNEKELKAQSALVKNFSKDLDAVKKESTVIYTRSEFKRLLIEAVKDAKMRVEKTVKEEFPRSAEFAKLSKELKLAAKRQKVADESPARR